MEDIFCYELAPIPTSFFADTGDMRITNLEKETAGGESGRTRQQPDLVIIDGCAILWITPLAISGYSARFCEWFLAVHPGEVDLQ